jgi:hypothetical protein
MIPKWDHNILDFWLPRSMDSAVEYGVALDISNWGREFMTIPQLGRLERSQLRDAWESEARHFTPWLALPDNIALLGDALGLELEVQRTERPVGPFRADILCKDISSGNWVLIENQLERTDHTHLGQLLTYASGLDAVTIIWIAARFTEEHRSTLDWLNKITDGSCLFFGLEVELWRIGQSAPAPKFNIVSKPNDWSKSVSSAAHALEAGPESEIQTFQRDYWTAFNRVLSAAGGPIQGNKKPLAQKTMNFPIGRSQFYLRAVMVRTKKRILAELYIRGPRAKQAFEMLYRDREAVERELGSALQWTDAADQDCRISLLLEQVDPEDHATWQQQHEWLARRLGDLERVFAARVRNLDLGDVDDADTTDRPT